MKSFASDNNSGVHPRIFAAMNAANVGSAPAYGADPLTEEAVEVLRDNFGPEARPWFVLLGTAANVLGLKSITRSHHGVICAETAHIQCDECGAPEVIAGNKLLITPSHEGKIRLSDCKRLLAMREDVHRVWPKVLSISQSTECGTVYTVEELRRISAFCRAHDLYLHMDGARLSNAAAYLGVSLRELSTDAGVDVLSFGGTKNGLMFGEAIIFLNPALGHEFAYLRKQHMQLGSKMRFMAAQFIEYMKNDLWRENALAANAATALLAKEIASMPHVRIIYPVQGNAIFARLHKGHIARLNKEHYFYTVDTYAAPGYPEDWHMVRLMTSFNTTEAEALEFAEAIRACRGENSA
jgi:threonine aldolase